MSAPLSFVPAPRLLDEEAVAPPALPAVPVTTSSPLPAPTEDVVVLPRHIADAAYHVVKAIHALKKDGSLEMFHALGRALDRGSHAAAVHLPGCDSCHVEVGQGFPHHPECWSEEAQRYRAASVPQPAPYA